MEELKEVRVKIGDYKIVNMNEKGVTIGLGSCVGIVLLERKKKIAALIHVLLPDSSKFSSITNPIRFADLAIPAAIDKLANLGCLKENLIAKIAGGASMFNFNDSNIVSNIGASNVKAVKTMLGKYKIPIIAEDTGGNKGRSMYVTPKDNKVYIRIVGSQMREL